MKTFKSVFMCFLITFAVLNITMMPNFSYAQQRDSSSKITIGDIRKEYVNRNNDETIRKASQLISILSNDPSIANRSRDIAEAYFLIGLSFFNKSQLDLAQSNFKNALICDSQFVVDKSFYGENISRLFNELVNPTYAPEQDVRNKIGENRSISDQFDKPGKVRVINEGAELHVLPNETSAIIRKFQPGSMLISKGAIRDWAKIVLPPDNDGIEVIGYLNTAFLEYDSASNQPIPRTDSVRKDKSDLNVPAVRSIAQEAQIQARNDVSGTLWLAVGCLLGFVGWLGAILIIPNPPAVSLLGKSPEYVAAYTDAYRVQAKSIQSNQALVGCLVGTGLEVLAYALLIAAAKSTTYYY